MYKKQVHTSLAIRLAQVIIFCALFVVQTQARFFVLSSQYGSSGKQTVTAANTNKATQTQSFQEKSKSSLRKLKLNKRYQSSDVLAVFSSGTTPFYFAFFNRYATVVPPAYPPVVAGAPCLLRGPPAIV